jgi:hypothetical protein
VPPERRGTQAGDDRGAGLATLVVLRASVRMLVKSCRI